MRQETKCESLSQLENIGFVPAGRWTFDGPARIKFECTAHANAINVLYAFIVDGAPVYVGKTVQPLCKRMQGYRTPGPTQPTNKRNNKAICKLLEQSSEVLVYVLPDNGLMHYGGFHVNLAAGLEDSIIRKLKPRWNGGRKETGEAPVVPAEGA
jgi:hypothetical protein